MDNAVRQSLDRPATAEIALVWLGVAWLQIVGVVTGTVVHHVLHAIPLAILGVGTSQQSSRHTRAMVGLAWVLMLTVFTPMMWDVLYHGVRFSNPDSWLAPAMLLIAALWSSIALASLRSAPSRWPAMLGIVLVAAVVGAVVQPSLGPLVEAPVSAVVSRRLAWLPLLVFEVAIVAGLLWTLVRWATSPPRRALTLPEVSFQLIYWIAFAICMVLGLAAD